MSNCSVNIFSVSVDCETHYFGGKLKRDRERERESHTRTKREEDCVICWLCSKVCVISTSGSRSREGEAARETLIIAYNQDFAIRRLIRADGKEQADLIGIIRG